MSDDSFPLWFHKGTKRWCKTIRGHRYYFGADKAEALQRWQIEGPYLLKGLAVPEELAGVPLKEMLDHFMADVRARVANGDLSPRTYDNYLAACKHLADFMGRTRPAAGISKPDWNAYRATMADWKPESTATRVKQIRTIFKWAHEEEFLEDPMRFSRQFVPPSAKAVRLARAEKKRVFTAAEIKAILKHCNANLRAMVLLGINGGFGPADCGALEMKHGEDGWRWIVIPRTKTGHLRRVPIWEETREAIARALAERVEPASASDANRVFIAKQTRGNYCKRATISSSFKRPRANAGISSPGFYGLRRTFSTVGESARDLPALRGLMGRGTGDIDQVYRSYLTDERLEAVTDHVHDWLYSPKPR